MVNNMQEQIHKMLPVNFKIKEFDDLLDKKVKINFLKKFQVTEYLENGEFPIIDQSKHFINGYTNNKEEVLFFEKPVIIFGDHTLNIKYVDFPFARGADGTQIIIPNTEIILSKYLYYHIKSLPIEVKLYERYFKYVKKSKFLVPDIPTQQQIIDKLDKQFKIIEDMKTAAIEQQKQAENLFMSYLNEVFENNNWEVKRLEKILKLCYGKGLSQIERIEGEYFVYGSGGIVGTHDSFLIDFKTIIVGRKGSVGEVTKTEQKSWPIDTTYYVKTKENLDFVYYLLLNLNLKKIAQKGVKPGLNRSEAYDLEIKCPCLSIQNQIVQQLKQKEQEVNNIKQAVSKQLEAIEQLQESYLNEVFGGYKL